MNEEKDSQKRNERNYKLIEWLKRLQEHVDRQERDIQMIKLKLQMM